MISEYHMNKFRDFLKLKVNKRKGHNVEITITKYEDEIKQSYQLCGLDDYRQWTEEKLKEYVLKIMNMTYTRGSITKKYEGASLVVKLSAMANYIEFLAKELKVPLDWRELKEELLKPDKVNPKPVEPFTDEEVLAFDRVTKDNPRDNAIIWSFLATGSRRCDIAKMNISHIDFNAETIKMYDTKTKQMIPKKVIHECIEAIQRYLPVKIPCPDDLDALWVNIYGKRLNPSYLYDIVKKYGAIAGIKGKRISPHVFKHTAISKMAKFGMSE